MDRARTLGLLSWLTIAAIGGAAAASETTPAARPTDLAGIERAIAAREYEASEISSGGLQAPNRAHNLRTYFDPTGIRVHDRTAPGSPELLALTLVGVGRDAQLAPVAPGEVASDGARVEIRRKGLVEWYVNSPAGLEQGFSLAERPGGEAPLVLELAFAGAVAERAGNDLVFVAQAGRRLRYGALHVVDAAGRSLAARFEVPSPQRVSIVVADAGAAYPLVIDPLLTETADAQLESDQANAHLGFSVASAGDVNGDGYADVIVGASLYDAGLEDEGVAFVFLGSALGIASGGPGAGAQLESNQFSAKLGSSVASAGDVNGDGYADVIVGAPGYALPTEQPGGAAFLFHGSAAGIASGSPATAATTLASTQYSGFFGDAVASAGDVNGDGYADVIVGAPSYDAFELDEGAAFVFHGSATGVASGGPATAAAQLESNQGGAHLGFSAASAGDVNGDGYADVIVGAPYYDAGLTDEGAAFVFHGSASGIASGSPATAATQVESNQGSANLGLGVAAAGDVNGDGYADVIVGTPAYDAGEADEGAAFVFHGSATGIASGGPATAATQLESNQPSPGLGSAGFGRSVAGVGDVDGDGYADVIVGASSYDAGQGFGEGAAFVFRGGASGVASGGPTAAAAQLEADQGSALFGSGVAGAGDVNGDGYSDVIVGAPYYDAGQADEGAVFVYHGGAQGIVDGVPPAAGGSAVQFESNQASANFSNSVASAGDVNGDGYSDVIVGASSYDAGHTDEGAAFLFLGSAAGIASGNPATAAAQLESNQAVAFFGVSVASAGDVNGDGYADVIVSAPGYDSGETNEGAAFVFLGSASGIPSGNPATAAAQLESNQASASFGTSVASAGDVNGDGYADVIVGSRIYDAGQADEGAAFVFLGSASGIPSGNPATAAAQLESNQGGADFGYAAASAGDVNGDGYADVIVGAHHYDAGETDEGAAFVFLGSAAGIASGNPATAAAQIESNQAYAKLGAAVAPAGDVNGDGHSDVIVGDPDYDSGLVDEGAAFVFLGSASGIPSGNPATAAAQLESNQASALFGTDVASAGDVNGDGYADVIVGAIWYDAGQTVEGAAFVFLGSAAGIASGNPATAAAQLESDQASSFFGTDVASAGDVNGDGYADVVVGAHHYDAGQTDEGAAFVFYGGGNRTGRPVLARQLRGGGGSLPVQPWGASVDTDDFQVRATATHPEGRGRVKLQVQACPNGAPFGHASCTSQTSPAWTDGTATGGGVTLTQTVAGLAEGALYRWRARVLHAPFGVTQAGITAPPNPAHGPWRRLFGQAFEADLRVWLDTDGDGTANSSDTDDDGDGLLDVYETNTGTYVSPTDTGTDPLDPDWDDDGSLDGAEVALGTSPFDPDHEDDGVPDGADNCPFVANPTQANDDAFPAGNLCQCGNVDANGGITAGDYLRAREGLVGRSSEVVYVPTHCDVNGDAACDVEDLAILQRIVSGQPATVLNLCEGYLGP